MAMYQKILVALENGPADKHLIPEVAALAKLLRSRLLLLHVADGWAARHFEELKLAESEEMREDRSYLDGLAAQLRTEGLQVDTCLALGNPPDEILKTVDRESCDLIAMATHGHRYLSDILHGSTIAEVRHKATVSLLLVRGRKP
jgi:nucleotide-binding universal stress UspA family protein